MPEQEDFTIDKNLKPSTTSDMLGFAKESNNININGTDDDSLDLQLAILAPKSTVNIKTNGGNISLNGLIIAENIKFDLTGGGTVRITYNNSLQSKPLPLFAQTLNLTK